MFFAMLFCGEKAWYTETDNSEFYRGEQVNTEMGNKIEGFQSCEKTERTFLRDLDILNIKG